MSAIKKPFASREKLKSLIVVYIQSESLAAQRQQQIEGKGTRATPTYMGRPLHKKISIQFEVISFFL